MPDVAGLPRRRRLAWFGALALVASALLAIAFFAHERLSEQTSDPSKAGVSTAAPGRLASSPSRSEGPASSNEGTVELCGYGRVAPIRTIEDYPAGVVAAAEAAMARIGSELLSQPQPRLQALGQYAQLVASMRAAGEAFARREPKCDEEACVQRRWQAAERAAAPAAQALARLAVASQDPTAYALGLYGCRLNRDGACAQLTAARWAQLVPGNAVPWFVIAEDANQRKDEAAMLEALHRAAQAKHSDYGWGAILALAEHPHATALEPASRLVFLSTLIGIYSAFPTPGYGAASQACAADRLADAARRQLCSDLATMMTERSASLLEFSLGTAIGERVGWPAERVQRLRDEKEAIFLVSSLNWNPEDVNSCAFLEYAEARTREFATLGELRAGRERIAASGRPARALAADWRALQRKERAAATSPQPSRPTGAAGRP